MRTNTTIPAAYIAEYGLITEVKRNIKLLERASTERGDTVNVFDISKEKNSNSESRILSNMRIYILYRPPLIS